MPWKFTKLVFCGVAIRRRTLYVIALVTSVAFIPTLTWSLLAWNQPEILSPQRTMFIFATIITGLLSLNAWRHVLIRKVFLYWEEARFIWPVAMLVLIFTIWLADFVGGQLPPATWTAHPSQMPLALPCVLAVPMLVLILWKWIRLPQTERRYEYDTEQPNDQPPKVAASPNTPPNLPASKPPPKLPPA